MAATMQEGIWQYKARWRSSIGYAAILFFLIAAVLLLAAAVGSGSARLGWAAGAIGCGWLAWLVGKPLFNGDWVLRIGPRGVSGYMLKGRTIPWRDIRNVDVETVQGHSAIVLTLAPDAKESLAKTRRWLSGSKPVRRIPLGALKPAESAEAVDALRATFAAQAGEHAAAAVQAMEAEVKFEAAFEQELARLTPTPWALYLVVALNVGVWLWNLAGGLSAFAPTSPDLFRWGANSAWAVTRDHEYWRLLTATFLHGGAIHLGMNMLGLWGAGQLLCRLYGNPQFVLIYLASALAGSAASLHFGAQAAVSVGASGAVFGVLGAVLFAARRHRERLPKALSRKILTSEGVFLAYALVNGFTRQGIDNAAHVGGLLAGAAMAWLLVGQVEDRARRAQRPARAAGAAALVAIVVAAMVWLTPSPRVDHRNLFAADAQLQELIPKLQAAQRALQEQAQAAQAGRISAPQFVEAVEKVHLPALRGLQAQLQKVPRAHGDVRGEATAEMLNLNAKGIAIMELQLRIDRGEAIPDAEDRMKELKREMDLSAKRLQELVAALKKRK